MPRIALRALLFGFRIDSHNTTLCPRRKSPAWFGLVRKHAELAVADVQYLSIMRDNCKARSMINKKCAPSFMLDVPNWIGMRRQWELSALPSCTATARPAP